MGNRIFVLAQRVNDNRISDAVVADYVFQEGSGDTVTDISATGGGNLSITGAYSWVANSGVGVDGLKMEGGFAASPITEASIQVACRASNEITLECWVTPTNTTQGASWPARIMTMAPDPQGSVEHNFMLGMGGGVGVLETQVRCRLRTDDVTVNEDGARETFPGSGSYSALTTADGILTAALLHHVVATFSQVDSMLRIYVDGVEVAADSWPGTFSNWATGLEGDTFISFGLGNEFGAAREFLGTYHRVAVHSRALTPAEVTTNHVAGPLGSGELPPPTINFDSSAETVSESIGSVALTVRLSRAADAGGVLYAIGVNSATNASMTNPEDYTLSYSGLIAEGGLVDTVTIGVTNDTIPENTEVLVLDLESGDATVGGINQYTLTVEDDDSIPAVSFGVASQTLQTTSTSATFTVSLDRAYSGIVTIPFTVAGSTASGVATPTTLAINPGELSAQGTVTYPAPQVGETVVVGFNGITNGTVGAIPTATYSFAADGFLPITPGANPDFTRGNLVSLVNGSAPAGDFTQQPYRTYLEASDPDSFVLSIFAGHHSGISNVSFQINEGTAVEVSQTNLDTDFEKVFFAHDPDYTFTSKGIEVYGVRCSKADFPKGRYVCRANKVAVDGSYEQAVITFWTDPLGDDGRAVRYVKNGTSGGGLTEQDPTGSIRNALAGLTSGQAEGAIIYLMPGVGAYDMGHDSGLTTFQTHDNDRAIEIRNHPSVNKAVIAETGSVFVRPRMAFGPKRIAFVGVGFDRPSVNVFSNSAFRNASGNTGCKVMIADYYMTGEGTGSDRAAAEAGTTVSDTYIQWITAGEIDRGLGFYLMNGRSYDMTNAGNNGSYSSVNTQQDRLGGAPFRGDSHILNCHAVDGRTGNDISWHPDQFHYLVGDRQLYRTDAITGRSHGWTISQTSCSSCTGQPLFFPDPNDDVYVNNTMTLHPQPSVHSSDPNPGRYAPYGRPGRGWVFTHYSTPWNHFNGSSSTGDESIFQDVWFHGGIVRSYTQGANWTNTPSHMQYSVANPWASTQQNGSQPIGWSWSDNHAAVWVNPAVTFNLNFNYYPNADYTPKAGSPLLSKVDMLHVLTPRYDLYGNLRGDTSGGVGFTAAGAIRGVNEVG